LALLCIDKAADAALRLYAFNYKISIGEIISVTGITAKSGLEGRTELFLSSFSTITKKN